MDTPAQAVLLLQPGAALAPLHSLLKQLGLDASPMHPGSTDPTLEGWYTLSHSGSGDLDAALARLQQAPGVDGAYRKPEGEPPG
ncbi:hypothetical protein ACS5PK_15720 [Roseateles sp. DB2]|uniref:hypothetical protein n=1 Tax=Roseateles sp. DB2 TaxID=3453717 RepID=UPI003EE8700B